MSSRPSETPSAAAQEERRRAAALALGETRGACRTACDALTVLAARLARSDRSYAASCRGDAVPLQPEMAGGARRAVADMPPLEPALRPVAEELHRALVVCSGLCHRLGSTAAQTHEEGFRGLARVLQSAVAACWAASRASWAAAARASAASVCGATWLRRPCGRLDAFLCCVDAHAVYLAALEGLAAVAARALELLPAEAEARAPLARELKDVRKDLSELRAQSAEFEAFAVSDLARAQDPRQRRPSAAHVWTPPPPGADGREARGVLSPAGRRRRRKP